MYYWYELLIQQKYHFVCLKENLTLILRFPASFYLYIKSTIIGIHSLFGTKNPLYLKSTYAVPIKSSVVTSLSLTTITNFDDILLKLKKNSSFHTGVFPASSLIAVL